MLDRHAACFEARLLKQSCVRDKPLVRRLNRMLLQLDLGAEIVATAASERAATRELALGGCELSLSRCSRSS